MTGFTIEGLSMTFVFLTNVCFFPFFCSMSGSKKRENNGVRFDNDFAILNCFFNVFFHEQLCLKPE